MLIVPDFTIGDEDDDYPDWARANDVVYNGPQYVHEGRAFKISCSMSAFDAPRWTRDGVPIVIRPGYHYEQNLDKQQTRTSSLEVWKATLDDTGDYR